MTTSAVKEQMASRRGIKKTGNAHPKVCVAVRMYSMCVYGLRASRTYHSSPKDELWPLTHCSSKESSGFAMMSLVAGSLVASNSSLISMSDTSKAGTIYFFIFFFRLWVVGQCLLIDHLADAAVLHADDVDTLLHRTALCTIHAIDDLALALCHNTQDGILAP